MQDRIDSDLISPDKLSATIRNGQKGSELKCLKLEVNQRILL